MIRNKKYLSLFLLLLFILILILIYFWFDKKKNKPFAYLYQKEFLNDTDFLLIQNECWKFKGELERSFQNLGNVRRYNLDLPKFNPIYSILKKYLPDLRNLLGNNRLHLADFPIQLRKYIPGSFMDWHRDVQMYKIPQYECILTLRNDSDALTQFVEEEEEKKIKSISSEDNSLMVIRANGVLHRVSPVTKGERLFLKFILTESNDQIIY